MIPLDTLERWQRYLTPGIHDHAPPTDHTDRELLREMIEAAMSSALQDELREAREEVEAAENRNADFCVKAEALRTCLNNLEDVLESTERQEAFDKVSRAVQRIEDV